MRGSYMFVSLQTERIIVTCGGKKNAGPDHCCSWTTWNSTHTSEYLHPSDREKVSLGSLSKRSAVAAPCPIHLRSWSRNL